MRLGIAGRRRRARPVVLLVDRRLQSLFTV